MNHHRIRFVGYAVCQTCFLTAAGYTADELGYTPDREPMALAPGHAVAEGEITTFGTAPCEGCGDRDAGSRYAVSVEVSR